MNGLNQFTGLGNFTADPKITDLEKKGTKGPETLTIANFTVAINSYIGKDDQHKPKYRTLFMDCKSFGSQAANIGKYTKKGSQVLVTGEVVTESWKDRETQEPRRKMVLYVNQINFLRSPKEGAAIEGDVGAGAPPPSDDDVPF